MKLVQRPPPANSLADFDLDDAAIAQIVKHAHSEGQRLSQHAPCNARGTTFYFWIVSGIRDYLLARGRGWEKRNVNGLEVIEHAVKQVRIAYLLAEGASGADMKSSRRGPMSLLAAEKNGQLRLLPSNFYEPTRMRIGHPSTFSVGFRTWFIAIERDGRDDQSGIYRIELALPTEAEGARFVRWQERIPIADVALDSEPKNHVVDPIPAAETTTPAKPKRRQKATPANDTVTTGTDSTKT